MRHFVLKATVQYMNKTNYLKHNLCFFHLYLIPEKDKLVILPTSLSPSQRQRKLYAFESKYDIESFSDKASSKDYTCTTCRKK